MAQYQNIFTQFQIAGPPDNPPPVKEEFRAGKGRMATIFGWLGNPQLGPVYLGYSGLASILCGIIAIEILVYLSFIKFFPVLHAPRGATH